MKCLLISRLRTVNYEDQAITLTMRKLVGEVSPKLLSISEIIAYSEDALKSTKF